MGLLKNFKKWKNFGWEEIDKLPSWVSKAFHKDFNKNYYKGNGNPYGKSYTYNGDRFSYKIIVKDDVQGGSYYYYRKNRGLEYPEGIPKNKKGLKRWQKGNQVIYTPKNFRNPFEP